jgi:hypothetical protein
MGPEVRSQALQRYFDRLTGCTDHVGNVIPQIAMNDS